METKRPHYVPKLYLKYFLVRDKRWFYVYDKKTLTVTRQSPVNTTVIKHYYNFSDGEENNSFSLEKFFSLSETETKPIFDRLINSEEILTEESISKIAQFLTLMYIRVPRANLAVKEIYEAGRDYIFEIMKEKSFNEREVKKDYERYCQYFKNTGVMSFKEFKEFYDNPTENGSFVFEEKNGISVNIRAAEKIYKQLISLNWNLFSLKEDKLITSDAPVTVFAPKSDGQAIFGAGFGLPNVEITFPLTPRKLLFLYRNCNNPPTWNEVNRRTACNAQQYIISSTDSQYVMDLLKEFACTLKMPKIDTDYVIQKLRDSKPGTSGQLSV